MDRTPVFVGSDHHQDRVQVCVPDSGGRLSGNRACENDPRRAVEYVATHGRVRGAAMESCEGAADFAEGLMAAVGEVRRATCGPILDRPPVPATSSPIERPQKTRGLRVQSR
jgi:hypothetical protein